MERGVRCSNGIFRHEKLECVALQVPCQLAGIHPWSAFSSSLSSLCSLCPAINVLVLLLVDSSPASECLGAKSLRQGPTFSPVPA
eukprot:759009-Hanusia_phi.AAC.5